MTEQRTLTSRDRQHLDETRLEIARRQPGVRQRLVCWLPLLMVVAIPSCIGVNAPEPNNRKKLVPVSGTVFVNGKVGWGVRVTLNPVGGIDPANPTMSAGMTNENGTVRIGTYGADDGAPAGEYILTFFGTDPTAGLRIGGGDPVDTLGGKYEDPEKSEFRVTVKPDDEKVDLGRIELTYEKEE